MANSKYYYDIEDDLSEFINFWCYIVIGGRNTGKTYSCLKSCYQYKRKFVFIKRTMEDVSLLCGHKGDKEFRFDLSPFKSINRDIGSNVRAFEIKKGLGGFYNCIEDKDGHDVPAGPPIGYIIALSAVSKYKGFDLSDCDWIIFDEFIPQPWDRINRKEGEQLMDLYKTVSRDREHRGKPALKLICLANATKISNPVCNILEITNRLVDMQNARLSIFTDERRGIFVHQLFDNKEFMDKEKQSQIYKAMGDTEWGRMALNNEFGYDDFTAVHKSNLKGFRPYVGFIYKNKSYYIWVKDGIFYVTLARCKGVRRYNLQIENERKSFYLNIVLDIQEASIDGRVMFEQYTLYDLIMNYREVFKL